MRLLSSTEIERQLIKGITYSDEALVKQTLKYYKTHQPKINDALVLHYAVKLGKVREVNLLLKYGIKPTAMNHLGLSALDICLIEMRNEQGGEIESWSQIALKLARKATERSKFTVSLLKLQKDQTVASQDWFNIHKFFHSHKVNFLNFFF